MNDSTTTNSHGQDHNPSGTTATSHEHNPSGTNNISHDHNPSGTTTTSHDHNPSGTTTTSHDPNPSGTNNISHSRNNPGVFVAVHAGAGNHSTSNEHLYKAVCSLACQQAMTLLKSRCSALEAVVQAVIVLENDDCTNAGKGSNLTIQGTVECDASAMDGQSRLFGAVGALSGIANPVTAAMQLIEEQKLGSLSLGRVRPSVLVGKGAQTFCAERGVEVNANLVSATALKNYIRYKRRCIGPAVTCSVHKRMKLETPETNNVADKSEDHHRPTGSGMQDTVGAICVDHEGNVAAATSSGGIWLKHSGRLGPSCMYGAGCWAQNQISQQKPAVAAVTSGCGEDLIYTLLAKTCSDVVRSSDDVSQSLTSCFQSDFLGCEFLASKTDKFGGVLILKANKSAVTTEVELSWIHSTSSMCLAHMAGNKTSPTMMETSYM